MFCMFVRRTDTGEVKSKGVSSTDGHTHINKNTPTLTHKPRSIFNEAKPKILSQRHRATLAATQFLLI